MTHFAESFAQAQRELGADPIESGAYGRLADHECEHGRLAGDKSEPCGCWPSEKARIITREAGG